MLRVENLTVSYGDRPAVAGVDLHLGEGEALGLVGESGCGKSTIARAILKLLPANSTMTGQVSAAGKIGLIFQDPMTRLNPVLTIKSQAWETIYAHYPHLSAKQAEARWKAVLEAMHLPSHCQHQYPHQLSGGQRQRVMIALTLLLEPLVLIADEPTTSLDITVAQEILTELHQLRRERGMGLILISHDLGLVAKYCDRLAVMHQGRIVEIGSVASILKHPQQTYTQYLLRSVIHWGEQHQVEPKPEVLLSVRHLSKTYHLGWHRHIKAVDDLSFQVQTGASLGIIGESGSGKSTTARLILRLIPADGGAIVFDGIELMSLTLGQFHHFRRHLQMICQDPRASFHPHLSILESVSDALLAHGVPAQQARTQSLEMLARVGIDLALAQRYPRALSGGQLQRCAIARALVLQPKLLICDEPVSMLDATIQRQVLELLLELQREFQLTYIFITHDLAVAQFFCSHLAVMQRGKIVEQGTTNTVFQTPQHPYTQTLLTSFPHL
ncbi:MAG: ABC transporter ATP-binding protein [Pseudanabaenaceae cyanobacterium]